MHSKTEDQLNKQKLIKMEELYSECNRTCLLTGKTLKIFLLKGNTFTLKHASYDRINNVFLLYFFGSASKFSTMY